MDHLKADDELFLVMEPENEYDGDAVAIYKKNEKKICCVPTFYSAFITETIKEEEDSGDVIYAMDYKYDSEAPSHCKVELEINGLGYENILKNNIGS